MTGTHSFKAKYKYSKNSGALIGVAHDNINLNDNYQKNTWYFSSNGWKYLDGEVSTYSSGFKHNSLVEVLVNIEEGWLQFSTDS